MQALVKQEAIKLRKDGKTYSEIGVILGKRLPKGTLSGWFKEISLTSQQKKALELNVATKLRDSQVRGLKALREKRKLHLKNILSEALKHINNIDDATKKIILSILYLGEGAKYKTTRSLRLGSTDAKIIQLYLTLLSSAYEINNTKMRVRIQCRADQKIRELEKYWKKIINIPNLRFYPTYIDRRTLGKPTKKKDYMGICTIEYFDTRIQLELEMLSQLIIEVVLGNKIDSQKFSERWLK